MTPTDAQIEAAAKALFRQEDGVDAEWDRMAIGRVPYLSAAEAALTAAAELERDRITEMHIERARMEDKVSKTQGPDSFHPDLVARLTVEAAEVGQREHSPEWHIIQATIERCAQVAFARAKAFAGDAEREIEAIGYAIRALKESEHE